MRPGARQWPAADKPGSRRSRRDSAYGDVDMINAICSIARRVSAAVLVAIALAAEPLLRLPARPKDRPSCLLDRLEHLEHLELSHSLTLFLHSRGCHRWPCQEWCCLSSAKALPRLTQAPLLALLQCSFASPKPVPLADAPSTSSRYSCLSRPFSPPLPRPCFGISTTPPAHPWPCLQGAGGRRSEITDAPSVPAIRLGKPLGAADRTGR